MASGRRGQKEIPSGLPKDWRRLAQAMREHGWLFEEGGKHVKVFAPDGVTWATLPKTPGDVRALRNAQAKFRRWCRDHGVEPGI
jgi:hypothetical protein